MKAELYTIELISNMHVGSGKDNFGVIDRLIQRDPLTNYPYIAASGLKGALLEHCCQAGLSAKTVTAIFGRAGDKKTATPSIPGKCRFLDAQMISIACPSNTAPFGLLTSKEIIAELVSMSAKFDISLNENQAKVLAGDSVQVLKASNFADKVSDSSLPVITRNHLENGKSANLWYEQVLPRKSRLYFFLIFDDSLKSEDIEAFNSKITKGAVQIGANATVGYGLCVIEKFTNVKK